MNRPSGSKGPDKKRTEAQQRLAELRAEQARKERRQKMLVIGVSVAAAAVIIGIVAGVLASRDSTKDAATSNGPSISAGQPFIPVGKASAPVVVDVYEDMQCPACAQFEPTFEAFIKPYMDRGDVRVNTHVVSFLDRASTNNYSSRAGNAVVCAADVSEDAFTKYKAKLYAEQPAEGGAGPENAELVTKGEAVGITSDSFETCVNNGTFDGFVVAMTTNWNDRGGRGTPEVWVGGARVDQPTQANLTAAIDKALKEAATSPSPSGSATGSPAASPSGSPAASPSASASPTK